MAAVALAVLGWDIFSGEVADAGDREVVLLGVDEFHVTDSAGSLPNLSCDALRAFASESSWPGDGGVLADLGLPLVGYGGEVGGEGRSGSGAVSTVGDDDLGVREFDAGVVLLEDGVLPGGNLAEEDSDDGVGGELEGLLKAGQVVGNADGACGSRGFEGRVSSG